MIFFENLLVDFWTVEDVGILISELLIANGQVFVIEPMILIGTAKQNKNKNKNQQTKTKGGHMYSNKPIYLPSTPQYTHYKRGIKNFSVFCKGYNRLSAALRKENNVPEIAVKVQSQTLV